MKILHGTYSSKKLFVVYLKFKFHWVSCILLGNPLLFPGDLPHPGLNLGGEDPLEMEMATHSSVLAWRIPRTAELVGCRLLGRTESDTTEVT